MLMASIKGVMTLQLRLQRVLMPLFKCLDATMFLCKQL